MVLLRFFKDFWLGLKSSVKATKFVFKNNLWPYFLFSALVAGLVLWLGVLNADDVMNKTIRGADYESLGTQVLDVAIWLGQLLLLLMAV